MIRNEELFKKIMLVSRELRTSAHPGPEHEHGHGHGERMAPPGPPMHGREMHHGPHHGEGERPPMPPIGEGRPPFPPKGKGMSRERLLVIISESPDGVRQKELAENAGINASSTSEVVSKLEDDGYLVRQIDPSDKRATILKLTDMGQVRAEEIRAERDACFDEVFRKLSDEEKQTLSDILDKLIKE